MGSAMRPGEDMIVTAIPLYHIMALMVNFITYFSIGADNWLVANPRDMDGFVDVLKKARPSCFIGVNTLYVGLVMHPRIGEVDFSNLRLSGGGGAAVVGAISAKWHALSGNFIREGYGLSETSPVVSFNPAMVSEFTGTTGLPAPGTDVVLLGDDDAEAGIGEPGEICVKGPQVMSGYWQKPDANAAAFTADGYFRTGDVGVFDAKGNLKIVDRKKDMIIVSGFNVFPNEVEEVATGCPGVAECACVGVADEKTGEAVKLFVVKAPGATLTAEELLAFCRKEMTVLMPVLPIASAKVAVEPLKMTMISLPESLSWCSSSRGVYSGFTFTCAAPARAMPRNAIGKASRLGDITAMRSPFLTPSLCCSQAAKAADWRSTSA